MKITRLTLYRVSLAAWKGTTRYGEGTQVDPAHEANVLRIDTDEGLVGWGECCTPPPYYLPTLSAGAREAVKYLAPLLLGTDPRHPRKIIHEIETAMRGHGAAKSVIEMALWDLCGKAQGLPLCDLWGGRVSESLPVLTMISAGPPEEVAAHLAAGRETGYTIFQIKIGLASHADDVATIRHVMEMLRPGERCWFDVNRGWLLDDAMQVLPKVRDLAPLIEQPCETYRECLAVSRRTSLGLMLDELMTGPEPMRRAAEDGILDVAVLKLACVGGLSKQRLMCDLGVDLGVPMRIEDNFGSGLTLAAVAHVATTLPERCVFGLYDYVLPEVPLVENPLIVRDGRVSIPADCGPGLGAVVNESILGAPVAVMEPA